MAVMYATSLATVLAGMVWAWIQTGSMAPQPTESISVDHPRPLAEVLKVLQDKYSFAVTYEDPAFGPADVVDVTDVVRRPGARASGHRVLGPRGGRFSVSYVKLEVAESALETGALLESIVTTYNASGFPGQFRVIQSEGLFHVSPEPSILDIPVSLPAAKGRNSIQALRTVFADLARASGQQFVFGTAPQNLLLQTNIDEAVAEAPARDVLTRILKRTGRRLSWRLLYSLDQQQYALNIRILN